MTSTTTDTRDLTTEAVSHAVHAAGLALRTSEEQASAEALRRLPAFYGKRPDGPLAAEDVLGLLEARRLALDAGDTFNLRIAVAAMDAALLMLGVDPDGKRVPVAAVEGNDEFYGRAPATAA